MVSWTRSSAWVGSPVSRSATRYSASRWGSASASNGRPAVDAQVQRYGTAAGGEGTVEFDEVVSVLRLVGRRPDAPLVFADAGRRAARYAARSRSRSARTLARVSPARLARRVSLRAAAR